MTSFRLRVKMRTSDPDRCTCTRAPSSFHSTDASPVDSNAVGDVLGAGREHRQHGSQHLERDRLDGLETAREREPRRLSEVPRPHRGPPRRGGRNVGGARDGVEHQALQRTLAELAGEQSANEIGLCTRGPRHARTSATRVALRPSPRPMSRRPR